MRIEEETTFLDIFEVLFSIFYKHDKNIIKIIHTQFMCMKLQLNKFSIALYSLYFHNLVNIL